LNVQSSGASQEKRGLATRQGDHGLTADSRLGLRLWNTPPSKIAWRWIETRRAGLSPCCLLFAGWLAGRGYSAACGM
jgi:hypothetical protein